MNQLKNIKINTPTYREIIPSTKTEVNISPFKVGDEKILLMASESKDPKQMIDSLKKVIDNWYIENREKWLSNKKKYRENLYGEQVEDDLSVWDTTLQDGLDNISYNEDQVETDSVDMEHKEIEEVNPEKEWKIKVEENDKFEDEEFNILDLDKDGVISEEEIKAAKTLLAHLQNQLATQSISGWRMNKLKTQIKTLEQQINNSENDITKIY